MAKGKPGLFEAKTMLHIDHNCQLEIAVCTELTAV